MPNSDPARVAAEAIASGLYDTPRPSMVAAFESCIRAAYADQEAAFARMVPAEMKLAARFLETAASEFGNHGCNDTEDALFDGIERRELDELVVAYNDWNESTDDPLELRRIPDFAWMGFLAHRLADYRDAQLVAMEARAINAEQKYAELEAACGETLATMRAVLGAISPGGEE